MRGQRFSSPEDAVEAFKNLVLAFDQSEETNTNDDRTSKHSEQRYAKKCQAFLWKCQISAGNTKNMPGQKFM